MSSIQNERSSLLTALLDSRAFRTTASITALALGFTLLQATEDAGLPAAVAATRPAPKVDSAPDRAAAHAAARKQGSPVEIEAGGTERVARFANPDGSTSVEANYADVRVRKDGAWVEIDPTLSEKSGKLKTRATRASVEISPEGASQSAPLARVAQDGKSLALDWPTALPKASVDGASATFDLAGPEQVQVTATNEGFNLRVRLDEAPKQAPVYRLPVLSPDLRLIEQPDGGYHAVDAKKNVVFVIKPLEMWDSNPATMDEGWQTARVPVDSEIVEIKGGGQELVMRPSQEWLTDPSRVAPIWIDPDVSTQDNARDAYIREGQPTSTAASTPTLEVGWGGATVQRQRALIEHDALPTLPAGSVVTGAKLTLRQRDAATCTPVAMNVYPINESWTSSATWNTRPGYSTSSATKGTATFNHGLEPGCDNAYQDIDITGMAQAWYATTSPMTYNGLTLMASPETATDGFKSFCSFNVDTSHSSCDRDTRMPKLTITYDAPPENATNLTASPAAGCTTGSSRPFVNSLVPLLSGSAAHTDGIPTRLQIELRTLAGTTNLATGTTGFVPAGATASWQVPGSTLTNGSTYRWRAKGDDNTQLSPAWSSWCEFTVDTAAPAAPTVSSTAYPANGWAGGAGTSGTFTLNPPNSDSGTSGVTGVQWSLDGGTPTTVATTGSSVNVAIVPSTDGKHVLTVHTLDKAGNLSTAATHTFFVGIGGLLTPALGARTAGAFSLSAIVKDATEVRFQYRRSETENWANVSETYFPVTAGVSTPYTWDAAAALGDGALQLRPVMFGGTSGGSGSAPVSLTVDQRATTAAKERGGPGRLTCSPATSSCP
ncbi:MAG: DNRLRE domain-containing protein, partial [Sporichthyaceae bacterium]